jgi:hypothetical protein
MRSVAHRREARDRFLERVRVDTAKAIFLIAEANACDVRAG